MSVLCRIKEVVSPKKSSEEFRHTQPVLLKSFMQTYASAKDIVYINAAERRHGDYSQNTPADTWMSSWERILKEKDLGRFFMFLYYFCGFKALDALRPDDNKSSCGKFLRYVKFTMQFVLGTTLIMPLTTICNIIKLPTIFLASVLKNTFACLAEKAFEKDTIAFKVLGVLSAAISVVLSILRGIFRAILAPHQALKIAYNAGEYIGGEGSKTGIAIGVLFGACSALVSAAAMTVMFKYGFFLLGKTALGAFIHPMLPTIKISKFSFPADALVNGVFKTMVLPVMMFAPNAIAEKVRSWFEKNATHESVSPVSDANGYTSYTTPSGLRFALDPHEDPVRDTTPTTPTPTPTPTPT
jgi:hypothetical protein